MLRGTRKQLCKVLQRNIVDNYIMEKIINYLDLAKVDIRVGTIIEANENNLLKKPSIVLKIDFGSSIGIKKSSAQLQANYKVQDLI